MMPRIYADFNGIQGSPRNTSRSAVPLDTYGSLRDLTNLGVKLIDGLQLTICDWSDEEEDLEAHASVYFEWKRKRWIAEIDEAGVLYVPASNRESNEDFFCMNCKNNLNAYFQKNGRREDMPCPTCGSIITEAIAPPKRKWRTWLSR
jgi:DNA-directed RNA polymerase subunit M/transcription elongation factor TFIIS